MRTRFHGCRKIAALCCIAVLLAAGTAKLLLISVSSSHKHGKAVSEVSSTLSDHWLHATAVRASVLPSLEIRGPIVAQQRFLPSSNRPLLRRLRGRAPPALS